jgi:BirA family biotin operon repressor/biotin-[acetyl-CoA-carboxylase] ligase
VVDRTEALVQVLVSVAQAYRDWVSGVDVRDAYTALSATLHHDVQAHVGDRVIVGRASRLGVSGELVLTDPDGVEHLLSAGDVTLLRPEH